MIKYQPKQEIPKQEKISPKRDFEDYLFSWIPDQPNSAIGRFLYSIALNNVFAPVALLSLLIAILYLPVLAFGKGSDWNIISKGLVAIGLPILVIGMVISKRFGNIVMGIWMFALYLAFVALVIWIMYPLLENMVKTYLGNF